MSDILKQALRPSPEVLSQAVAGETVLLDLASDQYFGLDEVGARIWTLVRDGHDGAGVVEALLGEYEVDRDRLEADVAACLEHLVDAGLLVGADLESGD